MKKKFMCTKEMPVYDQVGVNEWTEISKIVLSGYLGGNDLMFLSEMSKVGSLRILDMSDVTELNTDGMDGTIESTPFYNDEKGVEEVYLPNIEKLTYPMFISQVASNIWMRFWPNVLMSRKYMCQRIFRLTVTVGLILTFALWEAGKDSFLIMRDGLKI